MSSIKQEVAAILMDYTDKIPESTYMKILKRLGDIPDHKDPKSALELQKQVDELTNEKNELEDKLDAQREENYELIDFCASLQEKINLLEENNSETEYLYYDETNSEFETRIKKMVYNGLKEYKKLSKLKELNYKLNNRYAHQLIYENNNFNVVISSYNTKVNNELYERRKEFQREVINNINNVNTIDYYRIIYTY